MPSISYSVIKPASIRPLVAAGGGQAFRQQAGERRRRASSLQLASPPVATRNGLACLLAECAILTHKFCHRADSLLMCDFGLLIERAGSLIEEWATVGVGPLVASWPPSQISAPWPLYGAAPTTMNSALADKQAYHAKSDQCKG